MKLKSLKGIQDILPPEIFIWQQIERISREIMKKYGYHEIRLPIIEATGIFTRSIGEATDIVEKEMYTFVDKGDRSVTLRPEATASFVRAYVEHHLYNEPSPQKYYYLGPMFRYERPQAFRYRQFYQIGVEALGSEDPKLDTEVISLLAAILKRIGLNNVNFEITSIGCRNCRPDYKTALKKTLKNKLNIFCEDCKRRYTSNPLRILDCKVSSCIDARSDSPPITDFLCTGCSQHFQGLKHHLRILNISHTINPNLVRGLDYYTRTAFEVTSESLGSQKALAAGGRYDRLVKEFGGPSIPGIGFAIGMERLIPLIKESFAEKEYPDLFFCSLGNEASEKSFILSEKLRSNGLWVEISYDNSSLRSQMRKADRIGAKNVIVIGKDELEKEKAVIKNMQDGTEMEITLKAKEILKAAHKRK
ncbi:MAG: histidine--tRNA ligase [Candidatus Mariimomonas ferrooxydans]